MSFDPILVWFLAGLLLFVSEFFLPGVILVFFGIGAWVTALGIWMGLTPGLSGQLLVFAVSSVLLLVFLRRWFKKRFFGHVGAGQSPEDNIDGELGQTVLVTLEIHPGNTGGKVEFKGAAWDALSDQHLAAGSRAVITEIRGITLVVRPE